MRMSKNDLPHCIIKAVGILQTPKAIPACQRNHQTEPSVISGKQIDIKPMSPLLDLAGCL